MAENDLRLSTLPRRLDSDGITLVGYLGTGAAVGVDPIAFTPSAEDIGAVTDAELATALSGKQDVSQKGLANGYAPLDATGKVPAGNLPAGGGGGASLSDLGAQPLGPASLPGTAATASRSDHVHPRPTPEEIGASPIVHTHTISAVVGLQNALDQKENSVNKGKANGYAPLGSDGKVPSTYLPPGIDQASLDLKANVSDVTSGLATKADITYVDGQIATRASANDTRLINAIQPGHLATIETISANYSAVQADANKIKRSTATGAITVTLGALSVGTTIRFVQDAAGAITFAAGSGVTLSSFGGLLSTAGQNANVIATVIEANRWNISGNLA